MYKIQKFDDELVDNVFVEVNRKVDHYIWWNIFEIIEQPIQDIRLMRIKNQMKEEYFY